MLGDLEGFFGDVTPQGACVLLLVGLLTGFGLHDIIVWGWTTAFQWYAAKHDSDAA